MSGNKSNSIDDNNNAEHLGSIWPLLWYKLCNHIHNKARVILCYQRATYWSRVRLVPFVTDMCQASHMSMGLVAPSSKKHLKTLQYMARLSKLSELSSAFISFCFTKPGVWYGIWVIFTFVKCIDSLYDLHTEIHECVEMFLRVSILITRCLI